MPSRIPGLPFSWLRLRTLSRTQSSAAVMDSAATKFPMNLQILEPTETVPIIRRFDTPEALKIYVSAHKRAVLKALSTPTAAEAIIHPSAYSILDPCRTYSIYAPLHTKESADTRHHQVTDRVFEEKSRLALERFLKSQGLKVVECSRELYKLDNSVEKTKRNAVIEWDGFWTDEVGVYYVLECKHFMSAKWIVAQEERLEKTATLLRVPVDKIKLFLAGVLWEYGFRTKKAAQRYGYGVMYESGSDIAVLAGH